MVDFFFLIFCTFYLSITFLQLVTSVFHGQAQNLPSAFVLRPGSKLGTSSFLSKIQYLNFASDTSSWRAQEPFHCIPWTGNFHRISSSMQTTRWNLGFMEQLFVSSKKTKAKVLAQPQRLGKGSSRNPLPPPHPEILVWSLERNGKFPEFSCPSKG